MATTAMAGLFATAASAADMGVVKAPVAPPFSWLGTYVGINGGYGWGRSQDVVDTETVNTLFSAAASFGPLKTTGGFGGIQAGANFYEAGGLIFGIEADVQRGEIKGTSSATVNGFLPGGLNATVNSSNRVDWFGTVRPRIGFAWDRALFYATGGLAWGKVHHYYTFADNFGFYASDQKHTARVGYAAGGGIEYAFTPNLSLKAEYQYINLGTQHYKAPLLFGPGAVATVFSETTRLRTDFQTVRLGLNYRWPEAAPAPVLVGKAPVAPRIVDWTGVYVGLQVGSLWANSAGFYPDGNPALTIAGVAGAGWTTSYSSGGTFGGQIGYLHQFNQLVVGVEVASVLPLGMHANKEVCPKQTIALFDCAAYLNNRLTTAGARLGWAMGDWLPYVTGGYADTRLRAEVTNRSLAPGGALIIWHEAPVAGWFVGGGVDWMFYRGLTVGIDYRHYDFGDRPIDAWAIIGGRPGGLPNDFATFRTRVDTLALRVSWKLFEGFAPAPVTARY